MWWEIFQNAKKGMCYVALDPVAEAQRSADKLQLTYDDRPHTNIVYTLDYG